ncbi:hypothetical protein IHV25_07225 [Phaeovibrio sulfidiphilus]|uniref:Uncharacterized protein n=1 Tax=Phaeovibrio sulfidiphilus TaxID=1220600 RepID=A0A8J6YMH2_9PROT|nr:hypothetical protein [Phaeovibrio sulfidiphilus]MBE1237438.1 hypothetical protein [Phaeovibrio sulfidiphilus]
MDPALRSAWLAYCLSAGPDAQRYPFCREARAEGLIPSLPNVSPDPVPSGPEDIGR